MQRLLVTLLSVCLLFFQSTVMYAAGTTSATFLKLGIGAKNAAMGETGATETGVNAASWNPAGLSCVERSGIAFMHASWLEGISFQNVAYAARTGEASGIGVSLTYLSMSAIDKVDNRGFVQNDTYKPTDLAAVFSYARRFGDVPVGASVKYISSDIDGSTGTAFAADLGAMTTLSIGRMKDVTLGLAVQNIGSDMKYESESFPLPLTVRAGASWNPVAPVELALDLTQPVYDDFVLNLGGQYVYRVGETGSLAGRLGYRTNTKGLEDLAGLTAGIGIVYSGFGLDYAFVPYGKLDDTHRISVSYAF